MPPKKTKTKFKKNEKETLCDFVTRVVNNVSEPMTAKQVYARINKNSISKNAYANHRGSHRKTKGATLSIIQATLGYAAKKGMITKKSLSHTLPIRVHYMSNAIAEKIAGEDIPIPKYNKGEFNKNIHPEEMTPLEDGDKLGDWNFTPSERQDEREQWIVDLEKHMLLNKEHFPSWNKKQAEESKKRLGITIANSGAKEQTWIEVASLYYGVTIEEIEKIVLKALHAVDGSGYASLHLRPLLHKELGQ